MSVWQFQSSLNSNGTVTVPPDVAAHLLPDQEVRVVIVTGDDADEADWKRLAAEQFLNGYSAGDGSMTKYKSGDLVLVAFPYVQGSGSKRPALVIVDTGDNDVVLARVTTQAQNTAFDVHLDGWHNAGLLADSVVRVHKLVTLEKTLIVRKLGAIEPQDREKIGSALIRFASGW